MNMHTKFFQVTPPNISMKSKDTITPGVKKKIYHDYENPDVALKLVAILRHFTSGEC